MTPDVVVVGAGIVGCSVAYELAKRKQRVVVVERGEVGREASWAAAGILTPIHVADYPRPLAELCLRAQREYRSVVEELRDYSNENPELRTTGMLFLIRDEEDEKAARNLEAWREAHDQPFERRPDGLFLPDIAQVRNHRMTRALAQAACRLGVEIRTRTPVTKILRKGEKVLGVATDPGEIRAGTTILAAGCWSGRLGLDVPVRPAKGQMILTEAKPGAVPHMILHKDQYIVPRSDGKIIIGSTVEDAGFDKSVTFGGVRFLIRRAIEMLPELENASFVRAWAGLRPATPDRVPRIGHAPGHENLVLATGHYRNGILLGPLTGVLIRDLLTG